MCNCQTTKVFEVYKSSKSNLLLRSWLIPKESTDVFIEYNGEMSTLFVHRFVIESSNGMKTELVVKGKTQSNKMEITDRKWFVDANPKETAIREIFVSNK